MSKGDMIEKIFADWGLLFAYALYRESKIIRYRDIVVNVITNWTISPDNNIERISK